MISTSHAGDSSIIRDKDMKKANTITDSDYPKVDIEKPETDKTSLTDDKNLTSQYSRNDGEDKASDAKDITAADRNKFAGTGNNQVKENTPKDSQGDDIDNLTDQLSSIISDLENKNDMTDTPKTSTPAGTDILETEQEQTQIEKDKSKEPVEDTETQEIEKESYQDKDKDTVAADDIGSKDDISEKPADIQDKKEENKNVLKTEKDSSDMEKDTEIQQTGTTKEDTIPQEETAKQDDISHSNKKIDLSVIEKKKSRFMKDLGIIKKLLKDNLISPKKYEDEKEKIEEKINDAEAITEYMTEKSGDDKTPQRPEESKQDALPKADTGKYMQNEEAEELKEKEASYKTDFENIRRLFEDNLISKEEFDKSKTVIISRINILESEMDKVFEKEELHALKKEIEKKICDTLEKYNSTDDQILNEGIEKVKKLYNDGIITKDISDAKIAEIKDSNNRISKIIQNIDEVFDKYKKDILKDIESQKKALEEDENIQHILEIKDDIKEIEYKDLSAYNKILVFLGLKEKSKATAKAKINQEIESIIKSSDHREAIVRIEALLKKRVMERFNIEDEMTYLDLADQLEKIEFNDTLKKDLLSFFRHVSDSIYNNTLREENLQALARNAAALIHDLDKIKYISESEKDKKTEKKKKDEIKDKEKK